MAAPLLHTKLYISPLRSKIVLRPRLIERLDDALFGGFTLISAPAGFGKTTLLREWISQQDLSLAWFSIDNGDNDPIRFWTYVIAALQTVQPDIGRAVFAAIQTPQPPAIESLLAELINEITTNSNYSSALTAKPRFILVLDDYHLITESNVHNSLVFFLDNLPPQIHLIISGRSDPPWPLARLRARRKMNELRADDLRFSSQEIAIFLNSVMMLNISPENIAALERRTEGWIVGLQMAALSMQKSSDISAFIRAFTGTNRFILDYLLEEVLDQQSSDTQEFLLKTSLLEHLSADICDFILGRSNSKMLLSQIEKANLFLIPLDDHRKWYRYHHLFSELLCNQLTLRYPDVVSHLHQKASQWLEDQGYVDESVDHALAANDYDRLARLCEKYAQGMLQQSRHSVLHTWIEALPSDLIHKRPWLCVYQSWTRHWAGIRDRGDECLENAERMLENSPSLDEFERGKLSGSIATVRAHYALVNEQLPLAIEQAEKALQLLPDTDFYTPGTAGIALGGAYWGQGKIAQAEQAFSTCAAIALKGGYVSRASSALCYAGIQQLNQAKLKDAEITFNQALSLAQGPGAHRYPIAGYPLAKLGELACEWNLLEQARELTEDGLKLCKLLGHVDLIAEAYAALARVRLADADYAGVLEILNQADQLTLATKLDPWAITWLDDCRIQLWLSTGKLDQAAHWVETSGLKADGGFNFHYDLHHILLVKILVAQIASNPGNSAADPCLELISRLLAATTKMGWVHQKIQVLILQALVFKSIGHEDHALHSLKQSVVLAEPAGYIRTFIREGQALQELLKNLAAWEKTNRYLEDLLQAFVRETSSQQPGLAELLSPREMEVMNILTTSLSVPEIAAELVLSPNTVRSHIKSIYGKLGVNRRMDAIEKAKELQLV